MRKIHTDANVNFSMLFDIAQFCSERITFLVVKGLKAKYCR